MTDARCPVHGIAICSPTFNGCHLLQQRQRVHDAFIGAIAHRITVGEAEAEVDLYSVLVAMKAWGGYDHEETEAERA